VRKSANAAFRKQSDIAREDQVTKLLRTLALMAGVFALVLAVNTASAVPVGGAKLDRTGKAGKADQKRGPRGRRGARGRPGARGPMGPPGAQGLQGPPGIQSITEVVAVKSLPPGAVDFVTATCPAGMNPVSGGTTFISADGEIFIDRRSGSGWAAGGDNFDAQFTAAELRAYAYCSSNVAIAFAAQAQSPSIAELVAAQRNLHE
jgi:hypothetical protein